MAIIHHIQSKTWLLQMEVLFRACADQTRLRILNMLACESEICVYPLVEVLKTNQPKVSRHLSYLKRAGLIADRKDGLRVYYRLVAPLPEHAEKIMECLASSCQEIPEMQQDVQRLQAILDKEAPANSARQAQATSTMLAAAEEQSEIRVELL